MKAFSTAVGKVGVLVFSTFIVVTGIRVVSRYGQDLEKARAAAVAASQYADSVVAAAAKTQARADSTKRAADADSIRSARLADEAIALESELGRLEIAYALATQAAPDTCASVIAQADSVLEQAGQSVLIWHAAAVASQTAYRGLAQAYDSVAVANADLQRAAANLSSRTGELAKASKGSFLQRFLPHPYFGVTAGLDMQGRPAAVIGVGAGWRF